MARRDDAPKFHGLLSLFLNEHLPVRRKSSDKTIRSYRQSIKQFAAWNREQRGVRFDHMGFGDLSRDVVYDFLVWLRDERGLSPQTLNLRLSAIKAFLRFCGEEDVELAGLYLSVSSIRPFKGSKSPGIEFLEPEQLKELFAEPDASTKLGRRDRFLMILAYESGARMQELIDLTCGCVQERGGYITLKVHGKGDKVRIVPLASQAVEHLDAYLSEFHPPIRLRKIGCSSPFTAACTPRCRRAPSTTCSRNTLQPYTDATPPSPRTCTPTCSGTASPRLCTAPARRFRTSRTSSDMRIRARPWSTRMPTAAR